MYPHFLGIGAQKAGSTWLHHNLQHHPGIYLPPLKELHYFDNQHHSLFTRLKQKKAYYRIAVQDFKDEITRLGFLQHSSKLVWLTRYLFWPRSDPWYASLFPDREDIVCGEITPAYGILNDSVLKQIAHCMPQTKIIYLLRNPIHRSLSALQMFESTRNRNVETLPPNQIIQMLLSEGIFRQSDYLVNLGRWERFFERGQFFVGFMDEVQNSPTKLLRKILQFLEVDSDEAFIPETISTARNVRRKGTIPEPVLATITEFYFDKIVELHDRFDNEYTASWLREAQDCLSDRASTRTTSLLQNRKQAG